MKVRERDEWLVERFFEIRSLAQVVMQKCSLSDIKDLDATTNTFNTSLTSKNTLIVTDIMEEFLLG